MHNDDLTAWLDEHGTGPVAAMDGKPGCPVKRWSGGVPIRCDMGIDNCHRHGSFEVKVRPRHNAHEVDITEDPR